MNSASGIGQHQRRTARRLRANETDAERRLWKALRSLPVEGSHFRRQVPIGPYIADIVCLAARLVIEVDGSQHGHTEIHRSDAERTKHLEAHGFRVLRFWNSEVSTDLEGVLQAVHAAIHGSLESEPVPLKHERRRGSPHPAR